MRIIGHGIDIVETARIERMVSEHGDRFLKRCFTAEELSYTGDHRGRRQIEHLAGRFAAKEAVLKVLGTGWTDGIAWTDVEIVRQPSGQPIIQLHGRAGQIAGQLGIDHWLVSISHIATHAVASAIGASARDETQVKSRRPAS